MLADLAARYSVAAQSPTLGVVRLSGLVHVSDRVAFREVARQLCTCAAPRNDHPLISATSDVYCLGPLRWGGRLVQAKSPRLTGMRDRLGPVAASTAAARWGLSVRCLEGSHAAAPQEQFWTSSPRERRPPPNWVLIWHVRCFRAFSVPFNRAASVADNLEFLRDMLGELRRCALICCLKPAAGSFVNEFRHMLQPQAVWGHPSVYAR